MPHKCHMYGTYENYFITKYHTSISVYMPQMSSSELHMSPGTLVYTHFTSMTYAPKQTCLLHCIYMTHALPTVCVYRHGQITHTHTQHTHSSTLTASSVDPFVTPPGNHSMLC